ncbi:amidohydrolase family protein [Kitasatospora sp. SolWspMP-SS2h]|uniref:amidohydrolase family protein n=1 Tax=Kitasatospora sp. SolWspMP-SS2h TaxID=1305729 RepID=UPI00210112D5|nr:amidohydrolase family protein [Kitasatospora sp. SolWspMP-SS2h]
MLVAPHMISARGGHGDFSAAVADQYQGPGRARELAAADGCDEIRTRVRTEIRAGADWIKFAATGGFSSPSDDPSQVTYSQEEMDTLVATARGLGRPATPHCYGDEGVRRAVLAGVGGGWLAGWLLFLGWGLVGWLGRAGRWWGCSAAPWVSVALRCAVLLLDRAAGPGPVTGRGPGRWGSRRARPPLPAGGCHQPLPRPRWRGRDRGTCRGL